MDLRTPHYAEVLTVEFLIKRLQHQHGESNACYDIIVAKRLRGVNCSCMKGVSCQTFYPPPRITSLINAARRIPPPVPPIQHTHVSKMIEFHEPTKEEAVALFESIEQKFPHETLGDDKWYLVTVSALIGVEPEHAAHLYTYLVNKPQFSTSDSRQALIRRLREAFVKNISIQGVCKPIEAVLSVAKIERPEDKDYSFSREKWKAGPANREKGEKWLDTIYKGNLSTVMDLFKAHKDFDFISREITYGFYLSDHSILGPLETELVTLAGIMIQNLPLETAWHLRGTRRVGVSMEDVELVQQCVETVAKYGGVRLHKIPRVTDIEHEV